MPACAGICNKAEVARKSTIRLVLLPRPDQVSDVSVGLRYLGLCGPAGFTHHVSRRIAEK
jgi:hypothetical protein